MKSRYRAEAMSICDAGLSSYLGKAHKKRVSSGILTGIVRALAMEALLLIKTILN